MARKHKTHIEFPFTLPIGLVDGQNRVHRQGTMRLATAKDEILVQQHPQAQENTAYGFLVMLSQVIVRLGNLTTASPTTLENLVLRDMAYLREFFNRINQQGNAKIPVHCPHCQGEFSVELELAGEP
jgi:hypothetical protein